MQKRKPKTCGFCRLPKPRFRGWQNVRVSPGSEFFKTQVAISTPNPDRVTTSLENLEYSGNSLNLENS